MRRIFDNVGVVRGYQRIMLSRTEKLVWLIDSLQVVCAIPNMTPDELDYQLYENLDADIRAAFGDDNLRELAEAELIPRRTIQSIADLRERMVGLIDLRLSSTTIPFNPDWQSLIVEARDLVTLIRSMTDDLIFPRE